MPHQLSGSVAATSEVVTAVNASIAQHRLFHGIALGEAQVETHDTPPQTGAQLPVVVGVSGGADSICLLQILYQLSERWSLDLHVAHLNHSLRSESTSDAQFVGRMAAELGLPFHIATLPRGLLKQEAGSLEDRARRRRYDYLTTVASCLPRSPHPPIVAVAHHENDQAETLLINLIRGSGLRGLSGMSWITWWNGVRIVRPMLAVQRQQIQSYLRELRVPWVEDATNLDQYYVRNRLRHSVIPQLQSINPQLINTLGRVADTLREENRRSTRLDRQALRSIVLSHEEFPGPKPSTGLSYSTGNGERVIMDLNKLIALEPAARRGVIRLALTQLRNCSLQDIGFNTVDDFLDQLTDAQPVGVAHPFIADLSWTIGYSANDNRKSLSIHQRSSLPFEPMHPLLLRRGVRGRYEHLIHVPGTITVAGTWRLTSSPVSVCQLPDGWERNDDPWSVHLDAAVAQQLILTTPAVGQRFAPLGMKGKRKLVSNIFTDKKVHLGFRPYWPVVASRSDGQILWICGLQLAHTVRITSKTNAIVRLSWTRISR